MLLDVHRQIKGLLAEISCIDASFEDAQELSTIAATMPASSVQAAISIMDIPRWSFA